MQKLYFWIPSIIVDYDKQIAASHFAEINTDFLPWCIGKLRHLEWFSWMVLDRRLTRNAAFDEMFSEFIDFREPDLFMEERFSFDQTLVAFMSQVDNVRTKA